MTVALIFIKELMSPLTDIDVRPRAQEEGVSPMRS
jgi:hypothetical protein